MVAVGWGASKLCLPACACVCGGGTAMVRVSRGLRLGTLTDEYEGKGCCGTQVAVSCMLKEEENEDDGGGRASSSERKMILSLRDLREQSLPRAKIALPTHGGTRARRTRNCAWVTQSSTLAKTLFIFQNSLETAVQRSNRPAPS